MPQFRVQTSMRQTKDSEGNSLFSSFSKEHSHYELPTALVYKTMLQFTDKSKYLILLWFSEMFSRECYRNGSSSFPQDQWSYRSWPIYPQLHRDQVNELFWLCLKRLVLPSWEQVSLGCSSEVAQDDHQKAGTVCLTGQLHRAVNADLNRLELAHDFFL